MEFALIIYLIDVLCGPHHTLFFLLIMLGLAWIILIIITTVIGVPQESHYEYPTYLAVKGLNTSVKPLKILFPIILVFLMFIPDRDTAYKMLAAYGVQEIVTNPKVQEMGGKSLEVLNKAMDDYLKEDEPTPTK